MILALLKLDIMDPRKEKAIKILVENNGKSVSAAMREAGYSDNYAKNPQSLTKTEAWEKLMEQHFPDSKLARRHEELIDSQNELVAKQAVELAYKLKNKITDHKDVKVRNPEGEAFKVEDVKSMTPEALNEALQHELSEGA